MSLSAGRSLPEEYEGNSAREGVASEAKRISGKNERSPEDMAGSKVSRFKRNDGH